ncbi:MAG: PEGA domain-containing protein, partial [Myxococcota bacterium]
VDAASSSLNAGDVCTLSETLRAAPKTKRWKRRARAVRAGSELTIESRVGSYLKARVNGRVLYFKAKAVAKFCSGEAPQSTPASTEPPETAVAQPEAPVAPPAPLASDDSAFGDTIKIKVAVMDLKSDTLSQEERNALTQTLAETLDGFGAFKSVSSRDIASMLQFEAQKQAFNCDDESCIAEIGAALGADLLVNGSLVQVGSNWRIQLQLANIRKGTIEQRTSREFDGDSGGLFGEIRAAAAILVRDILGERSGTLLVEADENGANVTVDGALVGVTPLETLELAGGVHTVALEKAGFIVFRQDVKIRSGEESTLNVTLIPSPDFIERYESDAGFTRTLAWTSLGVGVLALGGAAGAYVIGGQEADELNADIADYNQLSLRSTARQQQLEDQEATVGMWDTVAVVSAGVGVAALATGIILWVSGDDPDRYEGLRASATSQGEGFFATVGPSGGLLGLRF